MQAGARSSTRIRVQFFIVVSGSRDTNGYTSTCRVRAERHCVNEPLWPLCVLHLLSILIDVDESDLVHYAIFRRLAQLLRIGGLSSRGTRWLCVHSPLITPRPQCDKYVAVGCRGHLQGFSYRGILQSEERIKKSFITNSGAQGVHPRIRFDSFFEPRLCVLISGLEVQCEAQIIFQILVAWITSTESARVWNWPLMVSYIVSGSPPLKQLPTPALNRVSPVNTAIGTLSLKI